MVEDIVDYGNLNSEEYPQTQINQNIITK